MLKNVKVKEFSELNELFSVKKENNICKNNYEFTLPLLFKNYFMEKILTLDDNCNLTTIYSITYDEVNK